MHGIKIGSQFVELKPDASISLGFQNPAFASGYLANGYSFPLAAPRTPNNDAIFGTYVNLNRQTAGERKSIKIPAELYIQGIQHVTGVVELTAVNQDGYTFNFRKPEAILLEAAQKYRYKDEFADIVYIPQAKLAQYILSVAYTGAGVGPGTGATDTLQIKLNEYNFIATSDDRAVAINSLVAQINAAFPHNPASYVAPNVLKIQQGLIGNGDYCVLEANSLGAAANSMQFTYDASSNSFYEAAQDNFTTYFNSLCLGNYPGTVYHYPMIYMPNFYGEGTNPDYCGFINRCDHDGQPIFEGTKYPFVPMVNEKFCFIKALNALGYTFEDTGILANAEWQESHFVGNHALDRLIRKERVTVEGVLKINDENIIVPRESFLLKNCVPDVTLADVMQDYATLFCGYFELDGTMLRFKQRDTQLASSRHNISTYTNSGYSNNLTDYRGTRWGYNIESVDTLPYNDQLLDVIFGDGYNRITPKGSTLTEDFFPDEVFFIPLAVPTDRFVRCPFTYKGGTATSYGGFKNDLIWQRIIYRGEGEDSMNRPYQFASTSHLDYDGNAAYTASLDWSGEQGLFNQFWRNWAPLILNGGDLATSANIPLYELLFYLKYIEPCIIQKLGDSIATSLIKEIRFEIMPGQQITRQEITSALLSL